VGARRGRARTTRCASARRSGPAFASGPSSVPAVPVSKAVSSVSGLSVGRRPRAWAGDTPRAGPGDTARCDSGAMTRFGPSDTARVGPGDTAHIGVGDRECGGGRSSMGDCTSIRRCCAAYDCNCGGGRTAPCANSPASADTDVAARALEYNDEPGAGNASDLAGLCVGRAAHPMPWPNWERVAGVQAAGWAGRSRPRCVRRARWRRRRSRRRRRTRCPRCYSTRTRARAVLLRAGWRMCHTLWWRAGAERRPAATRRARLRPMAGGAGRASRRAAHAARGRGGR
jgi:hypothetical protein